MSKTTFSKLRANLKRYCDRTVADRKPIRVRRRNGADVVLLAADEFDSLAETAYLLSSPKNAARLLESLNRVKRGKTKPMSVEKLRAAFGL